MDLLKQVMEHPIDPDYRTASEQGKRSTRHRLWLAVALVVVGALVALSAMQNMRTAPLRSAEREELVERVNEMAARQDTARTSVNQRQAELRRLRAEILGSDDDGELRDRLERLDLNAGTIAATGPGLVITVDDAPIDDPKGRIVDIDLQQMVNGLWTAGAEAIAINGHRLSSRSAIRGAGAAITVNYRSLTRPYRIEVIGDPATLQARYAETTGGIWWNGLVHNYGIGQDIVAADDLVLPADPGLTLRHARKGR